MIWHLQMAIYSASLALCARNSPATGEFPAQRPVTRSFDVFFDLRLNKMLSKQSRKNGISGKHNGNTHIWHSDLLEMDWHRPQTSIITLKQLSRVELWTKNATSTVLNEHYIHNNRKVWLKVQHLVIWYSIENLLHLYKLCIPKWIKNISPTFN